MQDMWRVFETTGRVSDYLAYKNREAAQDGDATRNSGAVQGGDAAWNSGIVRGGDATWNSGALRDGREMRDEEISPAGRGGQEKRESWDRIW